jgi:parallel beta-helix repeat protein
MEEYGGWAMLFRQKVVIFFILVYMISACGQGTSSDDGALLPGDSISECQRILEPGKYYLTNDLYGSPIEISSEAMLAPPYTGDLSLKRTCIEIVTSDVTLDCQGHNIVGSGDKDKDSTGIYIAGVKEPLTEIHIEGCSISAYQIGLYAGSLEGGNIDQNEARRNRGIGFYIILSTGLSLSENIIEGNDPDGILILGSRAIMVSNNSVFYNRMRGITLEGCESCEVKENESHSNGVLGFAIYASTELNLENNVAYNNRYHGFAILHEAGSTTFRGNSSYSNGSTGFYLEDSQNNQYFDNESWENTLDGLAIFGDSYPITLENNTLRDNGGFGVFSDSPIDSQISSANTFSGNALGDTGNLSREEIDSCIYTGFGPQGICDPVFEGGPNLNDPETSGSKEVPPTIQVKNEVEIRSARIEGEPLYFPSMGDLWMATWADDDRLFLTWGDGIGFGEGYPVGYPAYERLDSISISSCIQDDYFPCWLWCNVTNCDPNLSYPPAALTDAGLLAFSGPLPDFEDVVNISVDIPDGEPFFTSLPAGELDIDFGVRNDKPSSILFYNGRLYLAGHSPAGLPVMGYLAYSDDYGRNWTEVPNSPWGETSNFRVLMFINMGQNYALNQDGYVYAFGVGTEASWTERVVYLARVPKDEIADYEAYEYCICSGGEEPRWSLDETMATHLDGLYSTGQASAMYHEGTGRYLFLTTDANPPEGPMSSGALYEAPQPWGPWKEVVVLCFLPECDDGSYNPAWTDGKYIAGLIPKDAGLNHVYFTIAGGDLHYQLQIGKLVFDTGQ